MVDKEDESLCQDETLNDDSDAVDTTADFLKVFQGKTEFHSWEEFNTLFDKFQSETGSAFKPKSAIGTEYANERRVKDKIDDKFVYLTVKMVCQHFGNPVRRDSSAKKIKKYVGLGCEAMVQLRYKKGSLNIITCHLEHRNHKLFTGNKAIRVVRSFSFTDDVDFLMAKAVMEHNSFSTWNSVKEWTTLVEDLQNRDPRMRTVTVRVVKKRIRFLIEKYMANSNGKPPLPDDKLGIILYELAKAKQDAMDSIPKTPIKKRGRPRTRERDETDEDEEDMEESHLDFDDSTSFSPGSGLPEKNKVNEPASTTPSTGKDVSAFLPTIASTGKDVSAFLTTIASGGKDVSAFLKYMERKDEQDRKMRQQELDLRREELELHKQELELQKERFDFERLKRQTP